MATIETIYTGKLRTIAKHVRSGETITTDAPVDNQGKGEYFSPTDLMTASLGSCMLTIMGISAQNHGFSIDGTSASITKIMAENPRRVSEIHIVFNFPPNHYNSKEKKLIELAAHTCPVAKSLHPEIKQQIQFIFHE